MNTKTKVFEDIIYVSDGHVRRADIVVEDEFIAKITDKEELAGTKTGARAERLFCFQV